MDIGDYWRITVFSTEQQGTSVYISEYRWIFISIGDHYLMPVNIGSGYL